MNKLKQIYWPEMDTPDVAEKSIKNAATAAYFVAGITALLSILAWIDALHIVSQWSIIDAILIATVGYFIGRRSRVAAILGLTIYLVEAAGSLLSGTGHGGGGFSIVVIIFTLYFINGIRGAFSLARPRKPTDAAIVG